MRKYMILGAALLAAACGPKPSAQVEKVDLFTAVEKSTVDLAVASNTWGGFGVGKF